MKMALAAETVSEQTTDWKGNHMQSCVMINRRVCSNQCVIHVILIRRDRYYRYEMRGYSRTCVFRGLLIDHVILD